MRNGNARELHPAAYFIVGAASCDLVLALYGILVSRLYVPISGLALLTVGILIWRGGLKTAFGFSRFLAIYLSGLLAIAVLFPFVYPVDLLRLQLGQGHYGSLEAIVNVGGSVLTHALLAGALFQFARPPVVQLIEARRKRPWKLRTVAALGVVVAAALLYLATSIDSGPLAQRAKQEAARIAGEGFNFRVRSVEKTISNTGGHTSVTVTAWNKVEVRDIVIQVDEP